MLKALTSFSGVVSMREGETREIDDAAVVADLLRAGYVEEVKQPANGRTRKTAAKTED